MSMACCLIAKHPGAFELTLMAELNLPVELQEDYSAFLAASIDNSHSRL